MFAKALKSFLNCKASLGFKPGFCAFALAFMAPLHPILWNLETHGSVRVKLLSLIRHWPLLLIEWFTDQRSHVRLTLSESFAASVTIFTQAQLYSIASDQATTN